jgi:hypothetical protein
MDKRETDLLRTEALKFFGAIVAGQSHEATNVLNIINELVGLQGDILSGAKQGAGPDIERLEQVAQKIRNQVTRGEMIIRCTNRFAHSVDCPATVFDLKETLNQIADLAQRPANLGKTLLEREFPAESMALETSPFGVKQAVFHCFEIALASSSRKRHITVSYRVSEPGAEIAVFSGDPIHPAEGATEKQALLALLLQELGGKLLAWPNAEDAHRIVIFFPRPSAATRGHAVAAQARGEREDFHEA